MKFDRFGGSSGERTHQQFVWPNVVVYSLFKNRCFDYVAITLARRRLGNNEFAKVGILPVFRRRCVHKLLTAFDQ